MKYKEIKDNEEVQALIAKGNENLGVLGFTDHSEAHATLVAERAAEILESLGYKKKQIELVKVAAYMHDIGNAINRSRHAEYGAILANDLLKQKIWIYRKGLLSFRQLRIMMNLRVVQQM